MKQAGISILICGKIDIKLKLIRSYREGHGILIKERVSQDDITIPWEPIGHADLGSSEAIFTLPPPLQIQFPSLIFSSVADFQLWMLVLLCPPSQEILQILVSQPAFLFSVDPFSHTPLYNILISQLQLPVPRNIFYAEPSSSHAGRISQEFPTRQPTATILF